MTETPPAWTRSIKASQFNLNIRQDQISLNIIYYILLCTTTRCPQIGILTLATSPSRPTTRPKRWPKMVASRVARGYLEKWTRPSRYAFSVPCSKRNRLTVFSRICPPRVVCLEAGSRLIARRRRIVNDGVRDRRICLMSRRCRKIERYCMA